VVTAHEHLEAFAQWFRIGTEAVVIVEVYGEGAVDGHDATLSRVRARDIRHKLAFGSVGITDPRREWRPDAGYRRRA